MKKLFQSLLFSGMLFLMSCGGGEQEIKMGETFKVNEWDMAIETITSSKVLANDAKKSVQVAPSGSTYLKVRTLCNASDHVMGVFVGEEKLEEADYMDVMDFVSDDADIEAKYCEAFYLIKEGQTVDRIEIRGFGKSSTKYILKDVKYEDVTARTVNPKMEAFLAEFSSPQRLLDIVKKYTTKDVYEVVHESGMDVPANPMVRNFRIHYMNAAGTSYECFADALDLISVDVEWEGEEISKLTFSM